MGAEAGKAESGGWTTENMSQVKFRGEQPQAVSSDFGAEMRARQEALAKKREEVLKAMQGTNDAYHGLNSSVNRKIEQMGGTPAVKLETGSQQNQAKKRGVFGLFGRR